MNQVSSGLQKAASSLTSTGADLAKGITAPLAGVGTVLTAFGSGFEDAFTKVRKTVNLTGAELDTLQQGLLDLSTTSAGGGKSAEELASIASVAGQLGIEGADNLINFTRIAAGLSVATGITADQVGEDLTRIAVLTKTPADAWENMASSIVGLGNEMAGSEQDIIELTKRLAGALTTVGVSAPDILGIASSLAALGVNAEAGGTAISKFFLDMTSAASGLGTVSEKDAAKIQNLQDRISDLGTQLQTATTRQQQFGRNTPSAQIQETAANIDRYKREIAQAQSQLATLQNTASSGGIQAFANVAGTTADEFRDMVRSDPSKAFQAIVSGLARINHEQGPEGVVKALDALGVNEARMTDTLLRLSTGESTLAKGINVANAAWSENTALNTEVQRAMEATSKQFDLLLNELKAMAISAWPSLKAVVIDTMAVFRRDVLPLLQQALDAWKALNPEMQRNIVIFAGIAAVLGPALVVLGALVAVLGALLSPIGLVVLAVGALAAAWITNTGDIQGKTKAVFDFISGVFNNFVSTVAPIIAPAIAKAFDVFNAVKTTLGAWISFVSQVAVLLVTIWERATREIGAFFETFIKPPLQAIGQWISQWVLQPLIELLRFIGNVVASTGLTGALGGLDVAGAIRSAESAVAATSQGVAAGGPGTANNVVVNINNPSVPDQSAADRLLAQAQNAIIDALIGSERTVSLPQPSLVPWQPF